MAAVLALSPVASDAASVKSVGTSDLVANSQFVFHGVITEKWVAPGSRPGAIFTHMRVAVSDTIKGAPGRQSVVLSFLGGTYQGRTLRVEGLRLPRVGEEGVFFVERLDRAQVHPLYGWDQGRFKVHTDRFGRKTVFTHDMKAVRSVAMARAESGLSSGRAVGIDVSDDPGDAISLDSFKARVRQIAEAQQ